MQKQTPQHTPCPLLYKLLPGVALSEDWGMTRGGRSPARTRSSFISAMRPQPKKRPEHLGKENIPSPPPQVSYSTFTPSLISKSWSLSKAGPL
jgi:hypothetical protein